jgi:hypothetical protein
MRALIIAAVLSVAVLAAGPAQAQWFDECLSELNVSCAGMRVSVCPRGDSEFIKEGCGGEDDYIEVYIRDYSGEGISGIPWTDYWMNACEAEYELCVCAQHFVADALTDSDGRTTFSGRIVAGGCIPEGGIFVSCQGKTIRDASCLWPVCIDVVIVSPDINADCAVNLSDLSFFSQSYNKSLGDTGYDTCCDYNDDDACNLSDFSFMGEHYQHECQ